MNAQIAPGNPFPRKGDGSEDILNFIQNDHTRFQKSRGICISSSQQPNTVIVKSNGESLTFYGGSSFIRIPFKTHPGFYAVDRNGVRKIGVNSNNFAVDIDMLEPPLAEMWDGGYLLRMSAEDADRICTFIRYCMDELGAHRMEFEPGKLSPKMYSSPAEQCLPIPLNLSINMDAETAIVIFTEMLRYQNSLIGVCSVDPAFKGGIFSTYILWAGVSWNACAIASCRPL